MTQAPPVRDLVNSQIKACLKEAFAAQNHKAMRLVLKIVSHYVFFLGQKFLFLLQL